MPKPIKIIPEIRKAILEKGAEDIWKCYQCGKCSSVCPWFIVKEINFQTFRIPQAVRLGIVTSSEDKDEIAREVKEMFLCMGCEACRKNCPQGVGLMNIIRAVRRMLIDYGTVPKELKSASTKILSTGNPLGEPAEKRADWSQGLDIEIYNKGMDYLYFSCCMPAYDARSKKIAQATALILKKAGVSFGILGSKEVCCGESIRRVGSEKIFGTVSQINFSNFKEAGAGKILTSSPHCYTIFKKEYSNLPDFEVLHSVQLFARLLNEEKIKLSNPINKKIVYHDPCTLGRQNDIYDEPREVLKKIPGIELLEVKNFSRQFSICCGGGGGGIWMDLPPEERLTAERVKQLYNTGADIIAVACPYCLQMFEDSIKVMNLKIEVKDISELLFDSIRQTTGE